MTAGAGLSIEARILEVLKAHSIIMPQNTEGWRHLVPGAALAEARYRDTHGMDTSMPKPLMYLTAAVWDGLKLVVCSGAALGIYTAIEKAATKFS